MNKFSNIQFHIKNIQLNYQVLYSKSSGRSQRIKFSLRPRPLSKTQMQDPFMEARLLHESPFTAGKLHATALPYRDQHARSTQECLLNFYCKLINFTHVKNTRSIEARSNPGPFSICKIYLIKQRHAALITDIINRGRDDNSQRIYKTQGTLVFVLDCGKS